MFVGQGDSGVFAEPIVGILVRFTRGAQLLHQHIKYTVRVSLPATTSTPGCHCNTLTLLRQRLLLVVNEP